VPQKLTFFLAAGASTLVLSGLAIAQGTGDRSLSTAFFETRLEVNDNFDLRDDSLGTATIWTNTFGAGLEEASRTDLFRSSAQGSVRYADLPVVGDEIDADDPRLSLLFRRQVDDNSVSFNASYRRVDLDFFDPLDTVNLDGTIDSDEGGGTREDLRAGFALALNQDGPLSFSLTADLQDRNVSDTDNPDVDDRFIAIGRTQFGFRLSPILQATIGAAYDVRDSETGNDRERSSVDVGLNGRVNPRLAATASIGLSEVETTEPDGTEDRVSGVIGSIGFAADVPDGTLSARFGTTLDENGERYRFSIGRTLERPALQLDANVGVSTSEDTQLRPVGDVSFSQALPRGALAGSLTQLATTDEDGDNILVTSGRLTFRRNLTTLSSLDLSLRAGITRFEDDDESDEDRANFTVRYNRALTRDWGLNAGYTHVIDQDQGEGYTNSNAVFLTLRRDWEAFR